MFKISSEIFDENFDTHNMGVRDKKNKRKKATIDTILMIFFYNTSLDTVYMYTIYLYTTRIGAEKSVTESFKRESNGQINGMIIKI